MKISNVIDTILKHEGGYTNNPKDTGNYNYNKELVGTNFGISAKVFEDYTGKPATASDIKNMTEDTARKIYNKNYITPVTKNLGIPEDSPIFEQVVDMVVNHGYSNTVPIVQMAVNTKVDGASGKGTRKAIQKALKNPDSLQKELVKNRAGFYNDIVKRDPNQSVFLKGWLNRAYSFLPE